MESAPTKKKCVTKSVELCDGRGYDYCKPKKIKELFLLVYECYPLEMRRSKGPQWVYKGSKQKSRYRKGM